MHVELYSGVSKVEAYSALAVVQDAEGFIGAAGQGRDAPPRSVFDVMLRMVETPSDSSEAVGCARRGIWSGKYSAIRKISFGFYIL